MILTLFFTRGISLEDWVNVGLFDREKLIYEEHIRFGHLDKVYWITYGCKDKNLAEELIKENRLNSNIGILQMPCIFRIPKVGTVLYSLISPFMHKKILKKTDLLKTNQIEGSWSAVLAKKIYKKKLIVRTGFTYSQFELYKNGKTLKYFLYSRIEYFAYKFSDIASVSSEHDKEYLVKRKYLKNKKIVVLQNFIDTKLFKPLYKKKYKDHILFVGRINKQKNLNNLIKAVSKTNFVLDIYGKGERGKELEKLAMGLCAKVNFHGSVPNRELAEIYNCYKYYILPSEMEGMPKTLLEAMACGCICMGTDTTGINEVIKDGENGFLIQSTSSEDILSMLKTVISNDVDVVSNNAVKTIQDSYSLNSIVFKEAEIFKSLNK